MLPSLAPRAFLLALAAALGACAPAAAPRAALVSIAAAAPQTAPVPASSGPQALIWTTGEEGKLSTRWLAPAAPGYQQVAEAPGLLLASGPDVWRWSVKEEQLPTISCAEFNGMPPGEGTGVRVTMEKLGAADRAEIVGPPEDRAENQISHTALPIGSIGPYLFVRESTYLYGCGAHGATGVSVTVWDVSRRERVDLLDPAERGALDAGARLSAQRLLAPEAEEGAPLDEVTYAASLPRYGARAWLSVEHAFTTFACYACGDGEWSSYTRSVNVRAPQLPARARAYARPPAVVVAYLDDHPDEKIAGWSEVSPAAAGVLDRTLGNH